MAIIMMVLHILPVLLIIMMVMISITKIDEAFLKRAIKKYSEKKIYYSYLFIEGTPSHSITKLDVPQQHAFDFMYIIH